MNIEQVRDFANSLPYATEDMPYGPDFLVFRIGEKIFLHLRLDTTDTSCSVKLDPDEGAELREHYEPIKPAYHMNKRHWNDLFIDHLDTQLIESLIEKSYQLVKSRLPNRIRDTMQP